MKVRRCVANEWFIKNNGYKKPWTMIDFPFSDEKKSVLGIYIEHEGVMVKKLIPKKLRSMSLNDDQVVELHKKLGDYISKGFK